MTVYLPSGQFAFTWSQIARIDVYCPAHYVVGATSLPTLEFIDITNPLQPGLITVPVFTMPFQSNHVTLDHVIERAWYITDGSVEHDWNDWQVEFYVDPSDDKYTIRLAVYSFAQHGFQHIMPDIPSDYWFQRPP